MVKVKNLKFTLIVLITTVIVLTVVFLLLSSNILNVVKSNPKGSFENDVKALIETISKKQSLDGNFDPTTINNDNITKFLNISNDNYSSLSVIVKDDVAYINIIGAGKWEGLVACGSYSDIRIVEAQSGECDVDLLPPTINILGDNPINIPAGKIYVDAGAIAIDNRDGDLTDKISIDNEVKDKPGSYNVTYNVTDSASNVSKAIRTVNVIDDTAPSITFITNGNKNYEKMASTIIKVNDEYSGIDANSLKYQWTTDIATPSELSFTKSFRDGEIINTPTRVTGKFYLWILSKDKVGNTKIQRSNVFNIDNTKPTISILGNTDVNINVYSIYTDAGATAIDDVGGNITSKIITTGIVNPSVVGTYTITYSVTDSSGNAATIVTRMINVVDTTAPIVTFGTNGNDTYAKNYNTLIIVSDVHTGVNSSSLKYQWTTSTAAPTEASFSTAFINVEKIKTPIGVTGGYYLWILAKDKVGNTTIARTNVFNLDNTVPVISMNGSSDISINQGDVYTDAGAVAMDNIDGSISIVTTGTVNPNIGGIYTITYNATDNSGNNAVTITRTINVITRYEDSKGVNKPLLSLGMTPIKWDGSTWVDTIEADSTWYDYTTTDKEWANARTKDGSMWVWIPRYIYKIPTANWHTNIVGSINIQFSKDVNDNWNSDVIGNIDTGTTANASNGKWTNHPAFDFGSTQLTGIWVAKFEATATEGVANGNTFSYSCPTEDDNVSTKTIKIVPNVVSWRCISAGNAFTASRNMETNSVYG